MKFFILLSNLVQKFELGSDCAHCLVVLLKICVPTSTQVITLIKLGIVTQQLHFLQFNCPLIGRVRLFFVVINNGDIAEKDGGIHHQDNQQNDKDENTAFLRS